jgi:signal transduction histidine kinase
MIGRVPIRFRLTLPFALAMALVLAATGVFVYARVGHELLASVDQNLGAQLVEATKHAGEGKPLLESDVSEGPMIAQIALADGSARDSTPATLPPLLSRQAYLRARSGRIHLSERVAGLRGDWRLAAVPTRLGDGSRAVLVVGRSLAARDETLDRLGRDFLLAAPAALLLAIIAGYALAAAALRPVEAMRRRAAAISAATPGTRLPVPQARDELSALAVTLNDMLARLEAAFEHERRFVADASHELRTPLALLRTELELALRRPRPRAELEAALRSAAEETERLVQLSEDLLLIARADEGRLPLRREPVPVAELLERVRTRFAARAASLGRPLLVEPADGAVVLADPLRLEQALGNVVDNALHHGDGAVTLSARRTPDGTELHVTDEGGGFPASFVERAFDRFSRADEARSERGTGLGLAIVTLIASAHGGRAHAANRPQGGADVWLDLTAAS